MASFNKVIMMGNLTRDPQLSYLPSQTPVAEFGLAMTHRFKGNDGQMRDDVCFVDCRVYGRRAETIQKYCQKGQQLLVEGRLTFDRWETPEGQKRSKHRIFVDNFTFVGSRGSTGGGGGSGDYGGGAQQANPNTGGFDNANSGGGFEGGAGGAAPDDDIPF